MMRLFSGKRGAVFVEAPLMLPQASYILLIMEHAISFIKIKFYLSHQHISAMFQRITAQRSLSTYLRTYYLLSQPNVAASLSFQRKTLQIPLSTYLCTYYFLSLKCCCFPILQNIPNSLKEYCLILIQIFGKFVRMQKELCLTCRSL